MDDFTTAFIETISAIDASAIDASMIEGAIEDCQKFQTENMLDLELSGLDDYRAGRLFAWTRNGEGSGFWDAVSQLDSPAYCKAHTEAMITRDFSIRDNLKATENDPYHACQRLSDAARAYGEFY